MNAQVKSHVNVVEIVFTLLDGTDPVPVRFSDRPFIDFQDQWWADACMTSRPSVRGSRMSGPALERVSTPGVSQLTFAPPVAVREFLSGRTCEGQRIRIWRLQRSDRTISGVDPVFDGVGGSNDLSDDALVVIAIDAGDFLDVPLQPETWEGRGAAIRFLPILDLAKAGVVDLQTPSGYFNGQASLTVEVGFSLASAFGTNFSDIVIRNTRSPAAIAWALTIDRADGSMRFLFEDGVLGGINLAGFIPLIGTRYHAAGEVSSSTMRVGHDGQWDDALVISPTFVDSDDTVHVGSGLLGPAVPRAMDGTVDFVRIWSGYSPTWDEMTAYQNRPAPAELQEYVAVELLLNESRWDNTLDYTRNIAGKLNAYAQWVATDTGDLEIRGKRKPLSIGSVDHAPTQRVHDIFEIYAAHSAAMEKFIPRAGGRRLQDRQAWVGLTMTFDVNTQTIQDHRPGNDEWSSILALSTIRIRNTPLSDGDYTVIRDAYQEGDFYFLQLIAPPSADGVAVVGDLETISNFSTEATATGTVTFSNVDRTITADDGQNLGDFERERPLTVLDSDDNDGVNVFTIEVDPYQAAGKWVLKVNPAPVDGIGDTNVTLSYSIDTIGEYVATAAEGLAQVNFEPIKAITSQVLGSETTGSTPLNMADISEHGMANYGSADSQAIPRNSGRFATMARKFPQLAGYAGDISGASSDTVRAFLDHMVHGLGCHAWVSPRDGTLEMLDWPFVVRNPVPIDQAPLAQFGIITGTPGDLGGDPDSGTATEGGMSISNVTNVSGIRVEMDQVERPYVDSFLIRVAARGSKDTVTMEIYVYEDTVNVGFLGIFEVGLSEEVFEAQLPTSLLTDDTGGNILNILIRNVEIDNSILYSGALEMVPTWKYVTLSPSNVIRLDPEPSRRGIGSLEVRYGRNRSPVDKSAVDFNMSTNRTPEGREALSRATNQWQTSTYPAAPDMTLKADILETPLHALSDAEAIAANVFAGLGTNTFFRIDIAGQPFAGLDPNFVVCRLSGFSGLFADVTNDAHVVVYDEKDDQVTTRIMMFGKVV